MPIPNTHCSSRAAMPIPNTHCSSWGCEFQGHKFGVETKNLKAETSNKLRWWKIWRADCVEPSQRTTNSSREWRPPDWRYPIVGNEGHHIEDILLSVMKATILKIYYCRQWRPQYWRYPIVGNEGYHVEDILLSAMKATILKISYCR